MAQGTHLCKGIIYVHLSARKAIYLTPSPIQGIRLQPILGARATLRNRRIPPKIGGLQERDFATDAKGKDSPQLRPDPRYVRLRHVL
jgi:hypothetical protein